MAEPGPSSSSLMLETVDGEPVELGKARKQVKGFFFAGFVCLPFLWMANFWLFWPDWRPHPSGRPGDPIIKKYSKWSAIMFTVYTVLFIPWVLFYLIAGGKYLDPTTYHRLDTAAFPISQYVGF